jgi:TonB family protein
MLPPVQGEYRMNRIILALAAAFALAPLAGAVAQQADPGIMLPAPSGPPHVCSNYPSGAFGTVGTTIVDFDIGEDGKPRNGAVAVSGGSGDVDQAVLACVSAWKFTPATLYGKPFAVSWNASISWKHDPSGNTGVSSPVPDLAALEPMIHRLTIDTDMQGPLSTALKFTTDNKTWRCRQVFLDIKGEHLVRHWIAQGFDGGTDLLYSRTDNGFYIAIHVLADGTFVTAVSINDETGKGIRLNYADVKELLNHEITTWNQSVERQ